MEKLTPLSWKIFIVAVAVAVGIPAHAFFSSGLILWAVVIIISGLLPILGLKYNWNWSGFVFLLLFMIMVVSCVFLKISAERLLFCVIAILVQWDLFRFMSRLNHVDRVEKVAELEQGHLKRLMIIAGLGLVLGGIVLNVNLTIRFGWMLFLGIALIIGLGRFIERMSRED
jgi:hypothetical protein